MLNKLLLTLVLFFGLANIASAQLRPFSLNQIATTTPGGFFGVLMGNGVGTTTSFASSSPTVNYITATSTTASSTLQNIEARNISPKTSNTHDLGASNKLWKTIFGSTLSNGSTSFGLGSICLLDTVQEFGANHSFADGVQLCFGGGNNFCQYYSGGSYTHGDIGPDTDIAFSLGYAGVRYAAVYTTVISDGLNNKNVDQLWDDASVQTSQGLKSFPIASGAPTLRLTAGAAPTSINTGDMWHQSTAKAFWGRAAGLAQTFSMSPYTSTTTANVTNTVTDTLANPWGVGTTTLAANFWAIGKTIHISMGGVYACPIAGCTGTIKIKYNRVTLASVNTSALVASAANARWRIDADVQARTIGSSGTLIVDGGVGYTNATGGWVVDALNNAGAATTVNMTTSQGLDVTWAWDSAVTTKSATTTVASYQMLN